MSVFDSIMAVLSTLTALVLVLLAAWYLLKWMGKVTSGQRGARYISVLDRAQVGQDKWLLVVEIAGKKMALAMTSGAVTKLCELDDDLTEIVRVPPKAPEFSAAFAAILAKARKEKRE